MHKLSSFGLRISNLLQQIKTKNEAKFQFQGKSARSQLWFDLDLYFYMTLFQIHDDKQDDNTFKTFQVPIGNAKVVKSF